MDNPLLSTDPVVTAAAALAAVRDLRRVCADADVRRVMLVNCPRVLARIHWMSAKASSGELFSDTVLDDLRNTITVVERIVAGGTRVGYETYDAWDERGETTVLHHVEQLTPDASTAHRVQVRLERLEDLVSRTMDLIRARSLVAGGRPDEASAPAGHGADSGSHELTPPGDWDGAA